MAALLAAGVLAARVSTAATVDGSLFAFPGAIASPAAAPSAAVALADRWLGERPFDNPALAAARGIEVSPVLVRVSRQDLRAGNRNYDEQAAFIDGAGAWIAAPLGRVIVFAYAHQPVLRLEDNAFTRGTGSVDPENPPAVIATDSESREVRAGLGLSFRWPVVRAGVAGEWTRRDDHYEVTEISGSPTAGTERIEFSGQVYGAQAGVRIAHGESGEHPLVLGLGLRYLPELSLEGDDTFDPAVPALGTTAPISARRAAGWEGGLSARYRVSRSFAVLSALGGQSAQEWSGLDAAAGAGVLWSVAAEYQEPGEPWQFRFGLGQEQQRHVPEPRAGMFGLGFGWDLEGMRLDVAVLRRTLERVDRPDSYDDRVVVSAQVAF